MNKMMCSESESYMISRSHCSHMQINGGTLTIDDITSKDIYRKRGQGVIYG